MSDDKKNKNKKTPNRGLGRGLSALMADMSVTVEEQPNEANTESDVAVKSGAVNDPVEGATPSSIQTLLIDKLVRNPDQPRRHFDPRKLAELTESIRLKGVLQPLLVRPILDSKDRTKTIYQIVAGERRWQASLKAGLARLPVLVRELSDQDVLEIGVVENVQRANLNPIEEALAYKALTEQFNRTQDEIAKAIGKSRPHITNMLRLLTLPKLAQEMVQAGKISMGHARAIIAADDPTRLAQLISDKNLSVREAEKLVRQMREPKSGGGETKIKSADIRAVETELMEALGLKIDLRHKGPKGELRIFYSDDGQLDDIVRRLKSKT